MNKQQCFRGLQKTSLVDYPGKVACVLFTGGCNFRCPFCYNASLVHQTDPELPWHQVWTFLQKRKPVLQGLVISGGEPTLSPFLLDFIPKAKKLGYAIKLDTNGYSPRELEILLEKGLIDYIAMDIKNSPKKYAQTCGLTALDLTRITESIEIIKQSGIDYEFRTTITAQFHTLQDITDILDFTGGGQSYVLQPIHDAPTLSGYSFSSLHSDILGEMVQILQRGFTEVKIRT